MLKPVLDIGAPALVILTMVAVGLGLNMSNFRRVAGKPGLVAAATSGRLVCLPRIGLVVTLLTEPALVAGRATDWAGGDRADRFTEGWSSSSGT